MISDFIVSADLEVACLLYFALTTNNKDVTDGSIISGLTEATL